MRSGAGLAGVPGRPPPLLLPAFRLPPEGSTGGATSSGAGAPGCCSKLAGGCTHVSASSCSASGRLNRTLRSRPGSPAWRGVCSPPQSPCSGSRCCRLQTRRWLVLAGAPAASAGAASALPVAGGRQKPGKLSAPFSRGLLLTSGGEGGGPAPSASAPTGCMACFGGLLACSSTGAFAPPLALQAHVSATCCPSPSCCWPGQSWCAGPAGSGALAPWRCQLGAGSGESARRSTNRFPTCWRAASTAPS